MNEDPKSLEQQILGCIDKNYGIAVKSIQKLALGADFNTFVYHIMTTEGLEYFVKLRVNEFSKSTIQIPFYLANLGMKQIIAPLKTLTGDLWAHLDSSSLILYPYIESKNAVYSHMSKQHWFELGNTIKILHTTHIPDELSQHLIREDYNDKWRNTLKYFLNLIDKEIFNESIANDLADFLKSKHYDIVKLLNRAEELASTLKHKNLEYVLCHADIHGWNLLIDKINELFLVDWDTLILAPKERDLMFIGAGIWNSGYSSLEEEQMFYQGYGLIKKDMDAICYYRYERIIQDIGEYCEHVFLSKDSEKDKNISFQYLKSNFKPKGTIENASLGDKNK